MSNNGTITDYPDKPSDSGEVFSDWINLKTGLVKYCDNHTEIDTEALIQYMRLAWNHQQKKIDALDYYKTQWRKIGGASNLKHLVKKVEELEAREKKLIELVNNSRAKSSYSTSSWNNKFKDLGFKKKEYKSRNEHEA